MLIIRDLRFHHSLIIDVLPMKRKTGIPVFLLFLLVRRLMSGWWRTIRLTASCLHTLIIKSSVCQGVRHPQGGRYTWYGNARRVWCCCRNGYFPTGGKYRSLLGDFSSRTTEFVLKIPNRPKVLHPSGHPAKTVGSSRTRIETRAKRNRMSDETECQTNKT